MLAPAHVNSRVALRRTTYRDSHTRSADYTLALTDIPWRGSELEPLQLGIPPTRFVRPKPTYVRKLVKLVIKVKEHALRDQLLGSPFADIGGGGWTPDDWLNALDAHADFILSFFAGAVPSTIGAKASAIACP